MQNITILAGANEGKATNLIFDACRANKHRINKGDVTFSPLANGNHEAVLRNEEGRVIALAEVDKFDC